MKCNHCHENISPEGNLTPLFCPHCNQPWTKSQSHPPVTPEQTPTEEESNQTTLNQTSASEEEEELRNLRRRGDDGDKIALLLLGLFYFYGSPHTAENHALSAQYYENAFQEIPLSVLDQMRYYLGEPLPQFMLHHAITTLHTKALVGDHLAQIHVAYFATLCYPNTDFLDPDTTFQYLSQNPTKEATPLAICYQKGIGTEKNPRKALEILKQAVQDQDPLAQYTMAIWYQEGTLLPFDFPKSFHYASLSAQQDFPLGQILLGNMTFCGEATKENHSLGLKYLKYSSSLQGDLVQHLSPLSQIVAPVMYPTGITLQSLQSLREEFPHISYFPYFQGKLYEKEKNYPKAKECYQEAAKFHLTLALYQLAKLEESSQNQENPPLQINDTALFYHQEAANRYYGPSQTELGKYYLAPNPDTQNIPLAIQLFRKAALQQDGEANYQLGLLYLSGISAVAHDTEPPFTLEKNLPEALAHFKESWTQDYFPAKGKVFELQDLLGQ